MIKKSQLLTNLYIQIAIFLLQHITEAYQFKFKYTEKGPQMDIQRFGPVLCVCLWFRWCLCCYLMLMCPRNNDVEMHVTVEDTKRASVLLIRKLFLLMQNLNILPNNVYLTMKLYYYDDSECDGPQVVEIVLCENEHIGLCSSVTPADYQPPGFKEGECDSLWFEGTAVHFRVGEVQTVFHTLRVRVSAEEGRLKKLQEGNRFVPASKISKVGL